MFGEVGFLGSVTCNQGALYVVQDVESREGRACRGRNLRSDGVLAGVISLDVPVGDSPCVITERSVVKIAR